MGQSIEHTLFEQDSTSPHSSGSAAGPLLDTVETSEHTSLPNSFRAFVTSGIQTKVSYARNIYAQLADDSGAKQLANYDSCRSLAWFVRHKKTGILRVASNRCGLRWCPLCIKTRRMVLIRSVSNWMKNLKQPKFLTLTLKHTNSPLSSQIDNLYSYFKELKRRSWFKDRVIGGIWFFQVKLSEKDGLFHPHLHILFTGRYIDHAKLSVLWASITKGSKIVDIRAVKNPRKAVEYVARYASAPCELSDLPHPVALDVVKSLHGRRIVGTFGVAKGVKLTPSKPEDAGDWEYLADYFFVKTFKSTNENFKVIWDSFESGSYCPILPDNEGPPEDIKFEVMTSEPMSFKQLLFTW